MASNCASRVPCFPSCWSLKESAVSSFSPGACMSNALISIKSPFRLLYKGVHESTDHAVRLYFMLISKVTQNQFTSCVPAPISVANHKIDQKETMQQTGHGRMCCGYSM